MGPSFCLTVLDKVGEELETSNDPADQSKASIIKSHRSFANLGVLGPLLRDYTPLSPEDFGDWRATKELKAKT